MSGFVTLLQEVFVIPRKNRFVEVSWDENVCIHSGKCIKNLPAVFTKRDGKFVIIQNGAPAEDIRKTVKECPSGASSISE